MEAPRPPVQFGEDSERVDPGGPSPEFRAQRSAHNDEATALRHSAGNASEGEHVAGEVVAEEIGQQPNAVAAGDSRSSSRGQLANPMEPREATGVTFKDDKARSNASSFTAGGAPRTAGDDAWRSKRAAHYKSMAAAFRSVPPASDEESDSSSGSDR